MLLSLAEQRKQAHVVLDPAELTDRMRKWTSAFRDHSQAPREQNLDKSCFRFAWDLGWAALLSFNATVS